MDSIGLTLRNRKSSLTTDYEQCIVCSGWFKRGRGLKIHQTKAGCREKITGSYCIKSKSEAASTQESNHSDASGRTYLVIPENKGVPHVETMGSKMEVGIEKSKVEEKCEDVGEKSDLGERKAMKEKEEKRKEDTCIEREDGQNRIDHLSRIKTRDIRTWFKTSVIENTKETKIDKENKNLERKLGNNGSKDINKGKGSEILAKNKLWLRRSDFRSLQGRNYLNDKIIDQYFNLVQERSETDESCKVQVCSTFLYTKLQSLGLKEGMKDTKNWIKEDLRQYDLIFFPIHQRDHWSLIMVEIKTKTIHYLDSLGGSRQTSPAPRVMKEFMEKYYEEKGKEESFKIRIRNDAPTQENGVDCGVFICQYAERLSRKGAMNFRQKDLEGVREKMTIELMEGKIGQVGQLKNDSLNTNKQHGKAKPQKKKEKIGQEEKTEIPKENKPTKPQKHQTTGKEKIDWPKANSKEWEELDDDITSLLKILISPVENKAKTHPEIIYQMCKERFGVKERKPRAQPSGPSKRQKICAELRKEIKILQKTYKNAPEEEKEAIKQLQDDKIRKLRLKKRAESIRKNRKAFSRNCSKFLSQPFDFAREIISPKPIGEMKSSKEEVEQHLKKAHGDDRKNEAREETEELLEYSMPEVEFENEAPSWAEFNKRLRKTRTKSAPGPNGVPYIVYKRCPGVARQLWLYLRGMWKKNEMSDNWRTAEGIFIPKENEAVKVEKFRTISLLNVEGKLYFALRADRLVKYTLANGYIDRSIQKGGVPEVSGCLEHTAILSQLIREAKEEKKELVVTWLDIANAYGSLPHNLIHLALKRAHVPDEFRKLVESYYDNMHIRFTTKEFTTEWQKVEKGIITGCTMSVILFALTMTMLVMSCKNETKGPKTASGQQQVNTRLFMDDIATTTQNLVQTNYLLEKLVRLLNWAGLSVKPEKCRSLVIIKGKVSQRTPQIEGKPVTSVTEKSVKYLGKWYNKTLNDKEQGEEVLSEVKQGLKKIQTTKIPGKYKAWMVQHMLLPKIMWPLTIYNIPESKIAEMQRHITGSLKRWLGLPKSFSVECLYSKSNKLQLPYSELTEEVKAAKARVHVTFQESEDPCVKGTSLKIDGGRKADTPKSVDEARSRLHMQEITGIPNVGREGLGLNPRKYYSSSSKEERRTMVVESVREAEEDRRKVKITGLAKQGAQTRWEVPEKKLSHREILSKSETSFKFLVKSVYDLLPTPANKKTWFGEEESCQLCGEYGSLNHILSGCDTALFQGRYRWRHDEVLREMAKIVDRRMESHNKETRLPENRINFVKEGEKMTSRVQSFQNSYLDGASDWKMMVELGSNLKFPSEIVVSIQRPDMLLISNSTKRVGMVELTVPSEERVEISSELKKIRYASLQEEGKANGWKVQLWAVEVGCRGFPASSMATFFKEIGITGSERNHGLKKLGEVAGEASRRIWSWSNIKQW